MPVEIAIPVAAAIDDLPRTGRLGGELCMHDALGNCLVEFVLPNRFQNGPAVPFKASWWAVQPELTSPVDNHAVHEIWFIGQGAGVMSLGARQLEVRTGQAIYIEPGTDHCVRATGTEELTVFSVWWP